MNELIKRYINFTIRVVRVMSVICHGISLCVLYKKPILHYATRLAVGRPEDY